MTGFCKNKIPEEIVAVLEPIKDNEEAIKTYGIHLGTETCKRILASGIKTLHLHTLNMEKSALAILINLGLIGESKISRSLPWRRPANVFRVKEDVRPIFWANRSKSYISRTIGWDEYPHGRWSNAQNPSYGALTVYQGHDVVALACPERFVVGLDVSEIAIKQATKLFSSSKNAENFSFLEADFFTWRPTQLFDLIFDYTFFCAIELEMRLQWASRIRDLLKPDGELITLIFPISDHEGGPPYKVSVSDYEEVLHPMGIMAESIVENDLAIPPRRGREKLGRWKKSICKSLF